MSCSGTKPISRPCRRSSSNCSCWTAGFPPPDALMKSAPRRKSATSVSVLIWPIPPFLRYSTSTSSGSSYQRMRSPTLARSRNLRPLGALSSTLRSAWLQLRQPHQRPGNGSPQAPVIGDKTFDIGNVKVIPRPAAERVVAQQLGEIAGILIGQLDNLQLGQEQIRGRDCGRVERKAAGQLDLVTHVEGVHEDVELARAAVKDQPPVAVQRVEPALGLVPALLQHLSEPGDVGSRRYRIEVADLPVRRSQAVQDDRRAAEQAQSCAALMRTLDESGPLLEQRLGLHRAAGSGGGDSKPYNLQ